MKALLYADLLNVRQLSKTMAALFLFFCAMAFAMHSISFLSMALVMVAIMLPLNLMSYDKAYGWDKLALSLPIVRRGMVCSKYLASLLFLCGTLALTLAASVVLAPFLGDDSVFMIIGVLLFCAAASLFITGVMLPVLYKFGVEKGRYAIMIIVWVPILIMVLVQNIDIENPFQELLASVNSLSDPQLLLISLAVLGVSLVWYVASLLLSVSIYQKKEF